MKIERISAVWCPSCLLMRSLWKKIEKDYPEFTFIDYDVDFDEEIVETRSIGKILPVCIFYKDGKEINRIVGEKKEKELRDLLEEYRRML